MIKNIVFMTTLVSAPLSGGNELSETETPIDTTYVQLPNEQRFQELCSRNIHAPDNKFLKTFAQKNVTIRQASDLLDRYIKDHDDTYVVPCEQWEKEMLLRILFVDHREELKLLQEQKLIEASKIKNVPIVVPPTNKKAKEHLD